MNQVLFERLIAGGLPNVDLDEWKAFLEWVERYISRNEVSKPIIVEIGTQKGRQKRFWMDLFGMRHIGIDISDRFGKPDILGDSHDQATLLKLKEMLAGSDVNVLYVDGDHSYESARRDYVMYAPLVHKGVVAFHDVKQDRFEVKRFWEDLMKNQPGKTFTLKEGQAGIGVLVLEDSESDPNEVGIVFPASAEKYIWLQSNGDKFLYTNFPEIQACKRYLQDLKPEVALDLGCGLGRASVYFRKRFGWKDTRFILADGDSGNRQLGGIRSGEADFYNSMAATEEYCRANGLENIELFNLEKKTIANLEGGVNLVYSFVAVGFHWPLDLYLKPLHSKLANYAILVFSMRGSQARDWVDNQVRRIDPSKYAIIDYAVDLMATRKSILVLRKI